MRYSRKAIHALHTRRKDAVWQSQSTQSTHCASPLIPLITWAAQAEATLESARVDFLSRWSDSAVPAGAPSAVSPSRRDRDVPRLDLSRRDWPQSDLSRIASRTAAAAREPACTKKGPGREWDGPAAI
eukprot:scaffold102102_cov75-Phaeocystis_antarctica.AAC.3